MEKNENIEIKRIIDILKRKKLIVVFLLVLFIIIGYFYSYHYITPEYKSTETLLLIPSSENENQTITNSDLTMNSGLISTYSNIVKNSKVLRKVIDNLGLNMTEEQLLNKIETSIVKDTHIIKISVADTDSQLAMEIAKELSNVFLNEIKLIYNLNNIGIVDEAQISSIPYNINHIKDIIIFLILGIFMSSGYILLIYILDNTVKKEIDIEKYIHVKTLGNIPINQNKKQELVERGNAKSYITECINTIRTNILYMNSTQNAKTILITSCTPREGKSWVASNIAASFAETNKKVLLIDADMRKGRVNNIFKVENEQGLSNYIYNITGNAKEDIELGRKYIKETMIPNLHILTSGAIPPNPSELLTSIGMKQLIGLVKNIYDIIILDAPPCKLVSDSIVLSTIVDSTVLIVNSEKTRIKDLKETKKLIENVDGKIIGAIINKVKVTSRTYNKSYYYGHSNQKHKSGMQQNNIITVDEIINSSLPKFENNYANKLIDEEEEILLPSIEDTEIQKHQIIEQQNVSELIKKQDNYLEKMANVVSDIQVQLNSKEMKQRLGNNFYEDSLEDAITKKIKEWQEKSNEEIKEEIKNANNSNELNKISNQLEKVTTNYEEILDGIKEIDNTDEIEQIYKEIREAKLDYKQLRKELKDNSHKDSAFKNINGNTLTKKELQEVLREEIYDRISNIKSDYSRLVKELVNTNNTKIEEMQEETKKILQQQFSNIDYTEQISQMSEMIENLKDSYLELSNIIRTNNNEEINPNNIIDLKSLKKQKEQKIEKTRKKLLYSIKEDISFEDLEKTAMCVVPITKKEENNESSNYEKFV